MRNITKSVLIIAIGLLIATSACKKDKDPSDYVVCNGDGPLRKVTYVGYGITITDILHYDENKRLVGIGHDDSTIFSIIDYNEDGSLRSKTNYKDNEDMWHMTYTWGNDSMVTIEESKILPVLINKRICVLDDNNQIIKEQGFYKSNDEWKRYNYFLNVWENGNITVRKLYDVNDNEIYTNLYEYDDKNNPFDINYNYFLPVTTKNNIIKEVHRLSSGTIESETEFKYEYNKNGFPTKLMQISNNKIEQTILFEYDCN